MDAICIRKHTDEPIPWELLLLADPSRKMIESYLHTSSCYLGYIKETLVGTMILKLDDRHAEIMNLAVHEAWRRKGIGSHLIHHAIYESKQRKASKLQIGTADTSVDQLTLYQKLGFQPYDRIIDFFIEHYEQPIYENGIQAKDMIRLEMSLT